MINMSDRNKYGIFVHGLHKTASMFLYKLFRDLAAEAGIQYYSANNKPANQAELKQDIDVSFCYCPVRHFALSPGEITRQTPAIADPKFIVNNDFSNLAKVYRIYQIRDPRDILVSQYFSFGFIHGGKNKITPEKLRIQKMTVDEYCLKEAGELYFRYKNILKISEQNNPNYSVVKYETMVLNYRDWLSKVITVFDFKQSPEEILEKYYQKYHQEFDLSEFQESLKHKRKMIPGDHQEKLQPSTINSLNSTFADILAKFYS